jgi:glycosyltransferase involved in cell wall biosynthesis
MIIKLKSKKKFIIYAPGVNTGGGLILLKSLIQSFPNKTNIVLYLDYKISNLIKVSKNFKIYWIKKNLISRLYFEYKLFSLTRKNDTVFTFTSIPPLFKLSGHVISYHQNSILLQKTTHKFFSKKKELIFILKRNFSLIFKKNIQEYIVQTKSMKKKLKFFFGNKIKVRILPFIKQSSKINLKKKRDGFVYVADGNDHKNHNNLLNAWSLLGKLGIKPKLFLTLDKCNENLIRKIDHLCQNENLKIINLEQISHDRLFEIYRSSQALIFPSFYESFGLPLVEATQIKLPIIASNLKYVFEVCNPDEIFDPQSSYSIMNAVRRFITKKQSTKRISKKKNITKFKYLNAKDFLAKLGVK